MYAYILFITGSLLQLWVRIPFGSHPCVEFAVWVLRTGKCVWIHIDLFVYLYIKIMYLLYLDTLWVGYD